MQGRQSEDPERLSALGAGSGAADVEYEQFLKVKEVLGLADFVLQYAATTLILAHGTPDKQPKSLDPECVIVQFVSTPNLCIKIFNQGAESDVSSGEQDPCPSVLCQQN